MAAHDAAGTIHFLPIGTVVNAFRILRSAESEGYLAEFDCEDGPYRCPLYVFLPRTRISEGASTVG